MAQTIVPEPKNTEIKSITAGDFAACFGEELSPRTRAVAEAGDFRFFELTPDERDVCLRTIVEKFVDPAFDRSGAHRIDKWERGWGENLAELQAASGTDFAATIRPKYFDKYDIVRFRGRFIKALASDFEYQMLRVILAWLFEKYLATAPTVYEFGCGTGHNLLWLREFNPGAKLVGLDWAVSSQEIIAEMVRRGILADAEGRRFDFFNPDKTLALEPDSAVYTVAALEQVGEESGKFLDYLLGQKPSVVVHVEPMAEFFDPQNPLDALAITYYKKRNWLWGLLTNLRKLESEEKIEILEARRTHLGHLLTDGYSVVVWRPK